jgi:hypothetical protein
MEAVIARHRVTRVILAYSDISYDAVMALAARARAAGAAFELLPWSSGALPVAKPVLAVTATRTGCGKSQVCRLAADAARRAGLRPVIVRHPMPYGKLEDMVVQRFATGGRRRRGAGVGAGAAGGWGWRASAAEGCAEMGASWLAAPVSKPAPRATPAPRRPPSPSRRPRRAPHHDRGA